MVPPHVVPSPAAFVGVLGPTGIGVGDEKADVTSRSTMKPVSFAELSVNVKSTWVPMIGSKAAVKLDGAGGGTWKTIGRIMSFSSCPRMWQCQTYSQPKL